MNANTRNGLIVSAIAILVVILFLVARNSGPTPVSTSPTATTTPVGQTTSDGVITFAVPEDFGLAVTQQQIPVRSYIPPCDAGFLYCLYYYGDAYKGTNFESAGLRIQKRTNLTTERTCLMSPPAGFDAATVPTKQKTDDAYATSVFANMGDAGAGHMASGSLYRLYVRSNSNCYEFETRVGQTQFANYPTGSIQEFTEADKLEVQSKLGKILQNISLPSGSKNLFPQL